jgi:NAD(P)-dependent dehydrogenase (short-subunit alcohol dehydrogenase family)
MRKSNTLNHNNNENHMSVAMVDNHDMVAVIVGSTSGFGRLVARDLSSKGATVVISGRRHALGNKVVQECTERGAQDATFIHTDICDESSVEHLFGSTMKKYGRDTHVFINAGICEPGSNYVTDTTSDRFMKMIDTNTKGTTYSTRYAFGSIQASLSSSSS